jgi:hypothetical protein
MGGGFLSVVLEHRSLVVVFVGNPFGGTYDVVAIETGGRKALAKASGEGVLGDHSHDMVARGLATQAEAELAGDAYAREWLKKNRRSARCRCGPIGKQGRRATS